MKGITVTHKNGKNSLWIQGVKNSPKTEILGRTWMDVAGYRLILPATPDQVRTLRRALEAREAELVAAGFLDNDGCRIGEAQCKGDDEIYCAWYVCPHCGGERVLGGQNFCGTCGIELIWEE